MRIFWFEQFFESSSNWWTFHDQTCLNHPKWSILVGGVKGASLTSLPDSKRSSRRRSQPLQRATLVSKQGGACQAMFGKHKNSDFLLFCFCAQLLVALCFKCLIFCRCAQLVFVLGLVLKVTLQFYRRPIFLETKRIVGPALMLVCVFFWKAHNKEVTEVDKVTTRIDVF